MKLYVLRHGMTECNRAHRYSGRFDEDINGIGVAQAEKAAAEIAELPIDLIVCSPMLRTRHTCKIVNAGGLPVIYADWAMERDCGVLTNTPIDGFYDTDYWNYNSTKQVEGLETPKELFARVAAGLDELKAKCHDKSVLLVAHGGVARGVYFYLNPIPEDGMLQRFGLANCGMAEYEL